MHKLSLKLWFIQTENDKKKNLLWDDEEEKQYILNFSVGFFNDGV